MGAGISNKNMKRIMYNRLKAIQCKLEKHGVPVKYANLALTHGDSGRGFYIAYIMRASSNGETAAFKYASVSLFGMTNKYGWQMPAGDIEKGITEIIKYWGTEGVYNGQA